MTIEVSRRGFLAGLLGATVIAVLPKSAGALVDVEAIDPWAIQAPPGWTYQWITSAVMGDPCPDNVERFLDNGWTFVAPSAHPGAPVSTAQRAIETGGLILVQMPTAQVQEHRKAERLAAQERFPMTICKVCRVQVSVKDARVGSACSDVNAFVQECPGCFQMRPWWVPCPGCDCGARGHPYPSSS